MRATPPHPQRVFIQQRRVPPSRHRTAHTALRRSRRSRARRGSDSDVGKTGDRPWRATHSWQSTTQASVPDLCVDSWPCQSVVRGIDRVDPLRSFNHGLLVQNFLGPVGNIAHNSQNFSQTATVGVSDADLRKLVTELRGRLDELQLGLDERRATQAQLDTLNAQLTDTPNPVIVQEAGRTLPPIARFSRREDRITHYVPARSQ